MRTTIALALVGLTVALAYQPAPADELRLRKIHDHRLVIEGPYGARKGIHPSGAVRAAGYREQVGATRGQHSAATGR